MLANLVLQKDEHHFSLCSVGCLLFAWASTSVADHHNVKEYERLPATLAILHYLAFAILMLKNVAALLA